MEKQLSNKSAVDAVELPPLPEFFALGKTRINGEEHGHFDAKQMQDYARAAIAAARALPVDAAELGKLKTLAEAARESARDAVAAAPAAPASSSDLRTAMLSLPCVVPFQFQPTPLRKAYCAGADAMRKTAADFVSGATQEGE